MKKFFAAVVIIGLSAVYVFSRVPSDTSIAAPAITGSPTPTDSGVTISPVPAAGTPPTPTPTPTQAPTPVPVPVKTPAPVAIPAPATPVKTGFKDGVYTGSVADAYYGLVQVKATVSNGRLSNVEFLSYPNDRQESLRKSNHAMPILTQEAISAQGANVNTVSGATETSLAFMQSLADALAQAKA